ncbi:hypothetical protein BaRGS_00002759 [Batillaria attramentaria]|uniref:Uncharacterized protein n=1 Tax=Batillaria attramentaria TaxID=370345 RepID=A0ABD0M475_9CAEN
MNSVESKNSLLDGQVGILDYGTDRESREKAVTESVKILFDRTVITFTVTEADPDYDHSHGRKSRNSHVAERHISTTPHLPSRVSLQTDRLTETADLVQPATAQREVRHISHDSVWGSNCGIQDTQSGRTSSSAFCNDVTVVLLAAYSQLFLALF